MEMEEKFESALKELRKQDKRKFEQSIELIVNLKNFDIKKASVNLFVNIPYKIKENTFCFFGEKKHDGIDTITTEMLQAYKEKKKAKQLVKKYDCFIAFAKLMPAIATTLGKYLGPAGKMPAPQLGIVAVETDESINAMKKKYETTLRVRTKEPSIKIKVGREKMSDEQILANIVVIFNAILEALPKKKENIANVLIKSTMEKPIRVEYG